MIEIVEVGLNNYEGHKNTLVNFNSGMNVIVGPSDSGKTGLKRGIEAVLYNRYVSDEHIRHSEKSFSNYILFNNGVKITREKGGRGLNRYIIDYPDRDSLELNNFGTKVPQEVLDAHEMYLIKLGKDTDSLNCAYQLAGPFFLQNTAGERASIIGSIAKTQIIDEAVSSTLSKHRELKKTLKSLTTKNASLEKDINSYVWIDEASSMMDSIEDGFKSLESSIESYNHLESLYNEIEANSITAAIQRSIIESYQDILICEDQLNTLFERFKRVDMLDSKFTKVKNDEIRKESLIAIADNYNNIDELNIFIDEAIDKLRKYNSIRNKIESVDKLKSQSSELNMLVEGYDDTSQLLASIDSLSADILRYNQLSEKVDNLNSLLVRKKRGEGFTEQANQSLDRSTKKYLDMLNRLGQCPTCFSMMTDKQLSNTRDNLL